MPIRNRVGPGAETRSTRVRAERSTFRNAFCRTAMPMPRTQPTTNTESRRVERALAVSFRGARGCWIVRADDRDALFGEGAPDWCTLETDARAECVKIGHRRRVWRIRGEGRTVFAKVYELSGWLESIKRRLLGSPAQREWRAARWAIERGVSVVTPLAAGQCRSPSRRCVFLTEELAGSRTVPEVWEHASNADGPSCRSAVKRQLIDAVAQLLAHAHRVGFLHRDGHAQNMLAFSVEVPGAGLCTRVAYVDLLGARTYSGQVPDRLAAGALAQLDQNAHRLATRTQRLRFLRCYLRHRFGMKGGDDQGRSVRRWVADVAAAAQRHRDGLAHQRDRRLRRSGRYFASISCGGGWRAVVCLRLERRHLYPEPDVADRTIDEWRILLGEALPSLNFAPAGGRGDTPFIHECDGLVMNVRPMTGLMRRLAQTLGGSADRAMFERCHKLRHRDAEAGLVLAYAEHRRGGLVDCTVSIRPV